MGGGVETGVKQMAAGRKKRVAKQKRLETQDIEKLQNISDAVVEDTIEKGVQAALKIGQAGKVINLHFFHFCQFCQY